MATIPARFGFYSADDACVATVLNFPGCRRWTEAEKGYKKSHPRQQARRTDINHLSIIDTDPPA
jgi:hypothetical protein